MQRVWDHAVSVNHDGCSLVVQRGLRATAVGHLSNEYRHAQRNVDFLYEVEESSESYLRPTRTTLSFRLPRPVRPPFPTQPLSLAAVGGFEPTLRHAAQWISQHLGRGHAEWVLENETLWLVQFDSDSNENDSPPMARWEQVPVTPFVGELAAFRRIDESNRCERWRKTRSHAIFAKSGLHVPPVFVLDDANVIRDLEGEEQTNKIVGDFEALAQLPMVVRLDVDQRIVEWTSLPAIGPLTSATRAMDFVRESVRQAIRERGADATDIAIVVHHFVPSRGAAWATAGPNNRLARVDSIWGLPDGLQAYPYDTSLVNTDTSQAETTVRYKDTILDVDESGKWFARSLSNKYARREVLVDSDALAIAQQTRQVAKHLGRVVKVMWFVQADARMGFPRHVPWILIEDDEETLDADLEVRGKPVKATRALIKRVQLGTPRRIGDKGDLQAFENNPESFDVGNKTVLLRPEGSLLRDQSFIYDVADAAKRHGDWTVAMEGSVLAHATYQLRTRGVRVISVWAHMAPTPKRRFNKLVRDAIPDKIRGAGEVVYSRELQPAEFKLALREKLVEEALEALNARSTEGLTEEIADLLTVARALASAEGLVWADVETVENQKRQKRGGFDTHTFLTSTRREHIGVPASELIESDRNLARRHRDRPGLRLALVPPADEAKRAKVVKLALGDRLFSVEVRYGPTEIVVVFTDARKEAEQPKAQLRLPFR